MIDANVLRRLEDRLTDATDSRSALEAVTADLCAYDIAHLGPLLEALGARRTDELEIIPTGWDRETRVAFWRIVLGRLGLGLRDPVWSSEVLRRAVAALAPLSEDSINDMLRGAFVRLANLRSSPSIAVRNLVRDLFRAFAAWDRRSLASVDLATVAGAIEPDAPLTPAQAYLLWLALPQGAIPPGLLVAIVKSLAKTELWDELVEGLREEWSELDPNGLAAERLIRARLPGLARLLPAASPDSTAP